MPTNINTLKKPKTKQQQNHPKTQQNTQLTKQMNETPTIFIFFPLLFIYTAVIPPLRQRPWHQGLLRDPRIVWEGVTKENLESARAASLTAIAHTGNITVLVYLMDLTRSYHLGKKP